MNGTLPIDRRRWKDILAVRTSDNPPCGESKSRLVPCRTKGKVHQDAVHWIDQQSAQDKGMGILANNFPCRFFLNDSALADCLVRVNNEFKYHKTESLPHATAKVIHSSKCVASTAAKHGETCCHASDN